MVEFLCLVSFMFFFHFFLVCPFLLAPSTCCFTFIWTFFTWLRICSDFFRGYILEYILIFVMTVFYLASSMFIFFSRGCF
jgi:hypothetical protein